MGRPKGGKNRKYTKFDRYQAIKPCIQFEQSILSRATELGIGDSLLGKWVHLYQEGGIEALDLKWKGAGNEFSALHASKSLSEEDRLRLENLKLKVENERLKKGYLVKGVGANKEFATLKDVNIK